QMAKIFTMSERKIQRLFHVYVGATPKWVIQRFRLHEAAERLEKANNINFADFALEMNYFDQSHFIKDFKKTIGLTPEEYQKSNV
ncbi:MAG: helix-turn-helix domain-containing protein, partial [Nanoarchaeota archaeon]